MGLCGIVFVRIPLTYSYTLPKLLWLVSGPPTAWLGTVSVFSLSSSFFGLYLEYNSHVHLVLVWGSFWFPITVSIGINRIFHWFVYGPVAFRWSFRTFLEAILYKKSVFFPFHVKWDWEVFPTIHIFWFLFLSVRVVEIFLRLTVVSQFRLAVVSRLIVWSCPTLINKNSVVWSRTTLRTKSNFVWSRPAQKNFLCFPSFKIKYVFVLCQLAT